jgi:tetraacyldisaccharide 4'-kinase
MLHAARAARRRLHVLDDGFQHRRIPRNVDILCMDAARPLGRGMLLPAGDLREFSSGIRRASFVWLTRARPRLRGVAGKDPFAARTGAQHALPVHSCGTRLRVCCNSQAVPRCRWTNSVAAPSCCSARSRAQPRSPTRCARLAGAWWGSCAIATHHRFTEHEVAQAAAAAARASALLLTTRRTTRDSSVPPSNASCCAWTSASLAPSRSFAA